MCCARLARPNTRQNHCTVCPSMPHACSERSQVQFRPDNRQFYRSRPRIPARHVSCCCKLARELTHLLTDVVWNEEKQIGLIDSILRNYYMPPIIFGQSAFLSSFMHALNRSPQLSPPRRTGASFGLASMESNVSLQYRGPCPRSQLAPISSLASYFRFIDGQVGSTSDTCSAFLIMPTHRYVVSRNSSLRKLI